MINWDDIHFVRLVLDFGEKTSVKELFELFPEKEAPKILEALKNRKSFPFYATREIKEVSYFWFTPEADKEVLCVTIMNYDDEFGMSVLISDSSNDISLSKPVKVNTDVDVSAYVKEFNEILKTTAK